MGLAVASEGGTPILAEHGRAPGWPTWRTLSIAPIAMATSRMTRVSIGVTTFVSLRELACDIPDRLRPLATSRLRRSLSGSADDDPPIPFSMAGLGTPGKP
jgi:hypothetical protein